MVTRIDKADIANAGNYLNRELEQKMPGIYEKKYAQLWAEEGEIITSSGTLQEGTTTVLEEIVETVGEAMNCQILLAMFLPLLLPVMRLLSMYIIMLLVISTQYFSYWQ